MIYGEMSQATSKLLPSVPAQQVPFATSSTSSLTTQARNFFQSKNNATFHSTVENISEEDPLSSSALNPSNGFKMSTNNSYELEDMSVDKSLYGSSFHTDIDEYDLIASGDIKQYFTYTEKSLAAVPVISSGGTGADSVGASVSMKTDAKSKLNQSLYTDNDAVNNNSGNQYGIDEYGINEITGMYGNRSGSGASSYDQQQSHYYGDHRQEEADEGDQYYDSYGNQRKVPSIVGHDANATDYYYTQTEMGVVVGSNLEGIEELDEYERDEKEVEGEDQSFDYDHYYNGSKTAIGHKKESMKDRDTELSEFIEDDEGEEEELEQDNSAEYAPDEEDLKEDSSKQWDASDDEIIGSEVKRTTTTATTITTTSAVICEAVAPNPLSGISALMSSMSPSVVTQSSLSPGSMLAAGITTTLAANISNTITTTITGSPSIIFDAADNELGTSTISKTMGALTSGEGAPKVTAKQRWHHAYNKIIMQLNVSKSSTFEFRVNRSCGCSI